MNVMRVQLEQDRSGFLPYWRELADFTLPRRMRLQSSDVNKADKRNGKIIDSSATMALRTLRSGMMSGITSPARPWFRLAIKDTVLGESGPVREWLHDTGEKMNHVFLKSNLYNALPITYGDIGGFGTSSLYVEEDNDNVLRFTPLPLGTYCISVNQRLQVDVLIREFTMTLRQMIGMFAEMKNGKPDLKNFTLAARNAYEAGRFEQRFDIIHYVAPNEIYDPGKINAKYKKYASVYYEKNGPNEEDVYLRESGYEYFPFLCPRWEVTGEDTYGTECPGMVALGDIKQLQFGEKMMAKAVQKTIEPPLVAPTTMQQQKVSTLPSDITYSDAVGANAVRPMYEVRFPINDMMNLQQMVRLRIQRSFYEDLFLMLASSDRRQITAREIDERHEEKLLALGPVLEQLNQDLLDPLIDIAFAVMAKRGMFREPPEELQGYPLTVEYISVMAQAQKLVGIGGMERYRDGVLTLANANPAVLDKFDADQWVDVYADMCSVPPSVVRSDEAVDQIRQSRAQQEQEQAQAQQAMQATSAVRNLAQSQMGSDPGDNALNAVMNAGALAPVGVPA